MYYPLLLTSTFTLGEDSLEPSPSLVVNLMGVIAGTVTRLCFSVFKSYLKGCCKLVNAWAQPYMQQTNHSGGSRERVHVCICVSLEDITD